MDQQRKVIQNQKVVVQRKNQQQRKRKKMNKVQVPSMGQKITMDGKKLIVPDNPIIPFIEGDGIGPDIWASAVRVLDAAVEKAYGGKKKIHWMEVYAGEKSNDVYGPDTWLPQETLAFINEYLVAIKGPLTTPSGALVSRCAISGKRSITN